MTPSKQLHRGSFSIDVFYVERLVPFGKTGKWTGEARPVDNNIEDICYNKLQQANRLQWIILIGKEALKKSVIKSNTDKSLNEEKFTVEDTLYIKGIAITMLVLYHCFATERRLQGNAVDFFPFSRDFGFTFFESMNVCVGMFVFLSAFGLTRKYQSKDELMTATFPLKQIIKTHASFAIPYILCAGLSFFLFGIDPYGKGFRAIGLAVIDYLGLGGLLGTPMMVGTWWYMSMAYLVILLSVPTLHFYKKYGISVLALYLLPLLSFGNDFHLSNMTRWLLAIPLGVIISESSFFESCKHRLRQKGAAIRIIAFLIGSVIVVVMFQARLAFYNDEKAFYLLSSAVPVCLVGYIYIFLMIPWFRKALAFMGKHSGNIFMIHTFIRKVWLPDFTYSSGNWFTIALFVIASSLLISIMIESVKKLTRYDIYVKRTIELICKDKR